MRLPHIGFKVAGGRIHDLMFCSSVILFALYPAARHLVAVKAAEHVGKWGKSDPFDTYHFVNGLAHRIGTSYFHILLYFSLICQQTRSIL